METEALEKIGLTHGESKVYLALLKVGLSSAGPLTKEAQISRSKVYEILERLKTKGLVSSVVENGVSKFKAIDPRLIPDFLERKKQEFEEKASQFSKIIPSLLAEMQEKKVEQSVEVFNGWAGIRNTFNLLIKDAKRNDIWYAFGMPERLSKERARFFKHWRVQTDKIGIHQKLIANEKIRESPELAPKSKYSKIRYTQQETPTTVDIFHDYTLLGVWTEMPILIVVRGKEVAESFRTFFDHIWKQAKP
ncbi:hypothetical protein CL619_02770 [archaeon]|nr:hypothetical protein [archaeon]|tara:strand:+ start:1110 stop:1856 length:747 start_codon:yes stop_codon:yes gene_type:complete